MPLADLGFSRASDFFAGIEGRASKDVDFAALHERRAATHDRRLPDDASAGDLEGRAVAVLRAAKSVLTREGAVHQALQVSSAMLCRSAS